MKMALQISHRVSFPTRTKSTSLIQMLLKKKIKVEKWRHKMLLKLSQLFQNNLKSRNEARKTS